MPACRKLKTTGTFRPLQELSSPTSQPLGCQRGPAWPSRCVLWRHCRKSESAARPPPVCSACSGTASDHMPAMDPEFMPQARAPLCNEHRGTATALRPTTGQPRATAPIAKSGALGAYFYGGCGGGTPRRERQKDSRCQLIFRDAARRPHERQPLLTRRDALAMLIPVHGELRENVRQGELFS
jgi:hypothetical protein